MTHAGFRAWAKEGNLNFPDEKRYVLLHEVLRYCADRCLLACCFSQERRLREIAEMLDARYALTRGGCLHGVIPGGGLASAPLLGAKPPQ